ncbi:hypothetical protein [Methanothermococcus sp.]|uniref:hypothetical protein n=1 Tax=Methanothermococcus sp. TaxID=2614238 RepID=UPI0025FE8891|nr:hypothetical protein [Methanothermococcus sp.]
MFKVYRFTGITGIVAILLLLALLGILAILLSPLFIGAALLILIYIVYVKFKKSIKKIIKNIKKKKIKIKNESQNGEVEIHFAKSISVESKKEEKSMTIPLNDGISSIAIEDGDNTFGDNKEKADFIAYLLKKGLKFENNSIYYNDKLVYPIYKRSYPINEIIRLYNNKPKADIIILGLKGEPNKPKFTYLIPIEHAKERMTIDELRAYLTNI